MKGYSYDSTETINHRYAHADSLYPLNFANRPIDYLLPCIRVRYILYIRNIGCLLLTFIGRTTL